MTPTSILDELFEEQEHNFQTFQRFVEKIDIQRSIIEDSDWIHLYDHFDLRWWFIEEKHMQIDHHTSWKMEQNETTRNKTMLYENIFTQYEDVYNKIKKNILTKLCVQSEYLIAKLPPLPLSELLHKPVTKYEESAEEILCPVIGQPTISSTPTSNISEEEAAAEVVQEHCVHLCEYVESAEEILCPVIGQPTKSSSPTSNITEELAEVMVEYTGSEELHEEKGEKDLLAPTRAVRRSTWIRRVLFNKQEGKRASVKSSQQKQKVLDKKTQNMTHVSVKYKISTHKLTQQLYNVPLAYWVKPRGRTKSAMSAVAKHMGDGKQIIIKHYFNNWVKYRRWSVHTNQNDRDEDRPRQN